MNEDWINHGAIYERLRRFADDAGVQCSEGMQTSKGGNTQKHDLRQRALERSTPVLSNPPSVNVKFTF